ncbi:MAG: hypothetical protein RIR65_2666, partial [Planctomycetota bacterium]
MQLARLALVLASSLVSACHATRATNEP